MSEFTENEYDLIYDRAWDMLFSAHIETDEELDFNISECPVEHFGGLTDVEIKTAQSIMKKVKKLEWVRILASGVSYEKR